MLGLGSWTDDEFLLQTGCRVNHHTVVRLIGLEAIVRHYGTFLCKALHMLSLLREETLGDEQGEIGILHTRLLEHVIQGALHLLPYRISVRLDDHAAAHIALLCQVSLYYQFIVPLAVVLTTLCEEIQFLCHFYL